MEGEVIMDLVERARNRNMPYGWSELMDKMADEIERLRTFYEEKCDAYREASDEVERLDDEIERLQKAYANRGAEMDNMREVLATTQGWNEKATAKIEQLHERCESYKGQVKWGSDEIERLKERNSVLEIAHRQTHKTLDNAYAEIEQLRANDADFRNIIRELHRKLDDNPLVAEIERLKEQLRLYGSWPSTPEAKP